MRFNLDEYVTVHERIEKFYAKYPNGRITTSIIEHDPETGFILIRAEVFREAAETQPAATGHAYELRSAGHVQQGSYVEVCETSSVGRALALLGFEVKRGVASREEMQKASRNAAEKPRAAAPPRPSGAEKSPPSLDAEILEMAVGLGYDEAKVRRWVNQKYKVTGGLDSLTEPDKMEVLKIFREQSQAQNARPA